MNRVEKFFGCADVEGRGPMHRDSACLGNAMRGTISIAPAIPTAIAASSPN
jgi:hypothetical protein